MKTIFILLFIGSLSGCGENDRAQQVANSAATIYEAQLAQEAGASTGPVIKENAMAIIHAEGFKYEPGEKKK
jgi:hypothetical protein